MTLKPLRLKKNMTQAALAKLTGVSQSYIAELESGKKTNPTKETLEKLAAALNVSVSDLLDAGDETAESA